MKGTHPYLTLPEHPALSDQPATAVTTGLLPLPQPGSGRVFWAQSPDLIMGGHGLPYTGMLPASYAGAWSLCSPNRPAAYANQTDRGYPGYTSTHSPHTHEHTCSMHDTYILQTHTYTHSHNVLHEHFVFIRVHIQFFAWV